MSQETRSENSILWLRFIGSDLTARSVPISELAESMLALQQIITKAYQHETNSLGKASIRKHQEKRQIALQLEERRRDSDAYGFSSMFSDLIAPLIVQAVSALLVYAGKKVQEVIRRPPAKEDVKEDIKEGVGQAERSLDLVYVAVIYQPVLTLARRINKYSGAIEVEILSPQTELPIVHLTKDTAVYLKSLAKETYLGSPISLRGRVKSLLYDRNLALIEPPSGHDVRAYLSREDFESLRRAPRDALITLNGQPRFHLGAKTPIIREVEVKNWEIIG
jgi:hypothetical protein